MFGKKKAQDATDGMAQPGVRMKFFAPQLHTDTVVFVHGILGHYVTTWGDFPRLLSEDPDMPSIDILLWGYRTGWFARHHDLATEGRHLVGQLELLIGARNALCLVGHSMGGLVIFKGLIGRMLLDQAQVHPCGSVSWITLYASPLNGAWVAGVARILWGRILRIRWSLDKHLKDLSRGEFCTALMSEVVNRIYRPATRDGGNRRIPIRLVVATGDGAVDAENRNAALAMYRDPPPIQLDEDHRSVKLPTHVGDLRYRALAIDLQAVLAVSFKQLCMGAINPDRTAEQREATFVEILRRYGKIIRRRVEDIVDSVELQDAAEKDFLLLMAFDGAQELRPPLDSANRAMSVLSARYRRWR